MSQVGCFAIGYKGIVRGATRAGIISLDGNENVVELDGTLAIFATVGITGALGVVGNVGVIGDVGIDGTLTVPTIAAAANLTLAPAGDLILDPTGNDVLPATGYDLNLGALNKKYLTLHAAELWVETLVAQNTIATIGGRVLVAPTNVLTADLAAAGTSVSVKYNNFANGDRAYMEANGKVEFFAITSGPSGSGPYSYNVTRNLDGTGANDWFAGDAMLNTGTTGSGFIDLYSVRGVKAGTEVGPTIVGNVRLSSTYNDWAPRWAIGNLNGLFGFGSTTMGAAFGDPSSTHITIDATNGIRIRNNTTNKLVADMSGNLSMTGDLTIGTNGIFRSAGATALGTGVGLYMAGGTTPVFRVGDPTGNVFAWDGTTIYVTSATVAINAAGITISAPPTTLSTLYGYKFSSALTGTNVVGLFDLEPTAAHRQLSISNSTTRAATLIQTVLQAGGSVNQARIILACDTADTTIIDYFAMHNRVDGHLYPFVDNGYLLGVSTNRWQAVYAVNGTIQTSDRRSKRNIRNAGLGIDFVRRLRPRAFEYLDDDTPGRVGFITQEVEAALRGEPFAALVRGEGAEHSGLNYAGFVPVLVAAIQDIDRRLSAYERFIQLS